MARLTKSRLDEIFGRNLQELRQKVLAGMQKEAQLTTEDRYKLSELHTYFDLDSWESKNALLLLCGIDPEGVLINYGYSNYLGGWIDEVNIHHATFFGERDIYDSPTREEIIDWKDESKHAIKNLIGNIEFHEIGPMNPKTIEKIEKFRSLIKDEKNQINEYDKWLDDEFWNNVWDIRANYANRLSRYRKIWESGNHQSKNPIHYYIDWAISKGLEIPWFKWAKGEGLLSTEITEPVSSTNRVNQNETIVDEIESGDDIEDLTATDSASLKDSEETSKALPPRNLSGIAILFPIDRDEEINLNLWKKHSGNASRNGLNKARVSKSAGAGQSIFNPWEVGDWLVDKSLMPRDKVKRRMASNLEPGYEYMKDSFLS